MCYTVLVKNTFICVEEADDAEESLTCDSRRRAITADAIFITAFDEATTPGLLPTPALSAPTSAAAGTTTTTTSCSDEDGDDDDEEGGSGFDDERGRWAPAVGASTADRWHAEMLAALEVPGVPRDAAIAAISQQVRTLSFHRLGCNLVQRAFDFATPIQGLQLCAGLRDCAAAASRSSYAHLVLQKIIHCVGTEDAVFVAEGLLELGSGLALNAHSCAVLCRLLEHSADHASTAAVVDQLLEGDIGALCCHKFGHRAACSVLSNGLFYQRARIAAALRCGAQRHARHRFGTQVVQQALLCCPAPDAHTLAKELTASSASVPGLACHNFGIQVIRTLLQMPSETCVVRQALLKGSRKVLKDKFGQQLMAELGLAGSTVGALGGA